MYVVLIASLNVLIAKQRFHDELRMHGLIVY
jgi:hypothetical protein